MGRKKIDMKCKLPEGKINSTFKKRRPGAATKAMQLGILCDVDVAFITFNPRNDYVYAVSHGGKIDEIINKFHNFRMQHFGKIEFDEVLRKPQDQVQHQMHPNIQMPHLPPTFEVPQMGIQTFVGQAQGFDIQNQGKNGSSNVQPQGFGIQIQGNNGSPNVQLQLDIQAQGSQNNQQQLPQNQILPLVRPPLDFDSHHNNGQ